MNAARLVVEQGLRPASFLDELNAFLATQPSGLIDVAAQVQALLDNPTALAQESLTLPLPRLHCTPHLFAPLLLQRAPDFMLWLKRGSAQVLGLVDPKGLAREWPQDKIDLIEALESAALSLPCVAHS